MSRFSHIVFDYNGTLVNDAELGAQAMQHALTSMGSTETMTSERLRQESLGNADAFWAQYGFTSPEDLAKIDILWGGKYVDLIKTQLRLRKGMEELLKSLDEARLPMGILSHRKESALKEEIDQLEIKERFKVILGEPTGKRPSSRFEIKRHQEFIEAMGIQNPQNVLCVGDSEVDLEMAKQADFNIALLSGGWRSRTRLEEACHKLVTQSTSWEKRIWLIDHPQQIENLVLKSKPS